MITAKVGRYSVYKMLKDAGATPSERTVSEVLETVGKQGETMNLGRIKLKREGREPNYRIRCYVVG